MKHVRPYVRSVSVRPKTDATGWGKALTRSICSNETVVPLFDGHATAIGRPSSRLSACPSACVLEPAYDLFLVDKGSIALQCAHINIPIISSVILSMGSPMGYQQDYDSKTTMLLKSDILENAWRRARLRRRIAYPGCLKAHTPEAMHRLPNQCTSMAT